MKYQTIFALLNSLIAVTALNFGSRQSTRTTNTIQQPCPEGEQCQGLRKKDTQYHFYQCEYPNWTGKCNNVPVEPDMCRKSLLAISNGT